MELSELKEHIRVILNAPGEVPIETVHAVIGDLVGAIASANDLAEIALSRMSEHEQHQPIGKALKRLSDYSTTLVDWQDGFSAATPNQKGYWWHLLSEGCSPVPVWIMQSPHDGSYIATAGQLGWITSRDVRSIGGFWKKADVPNNAII